MEIFKSILYGKFSMPYIYSRPYVYSFCQIFQALRLFPALRLFRTLEYVNRRRGCNHLFLKVLYYYNSRTFNMHPEKISFSTSLDIFSKLAPGFLAFFQAGDLKKTKGLKQTLISQDIDFQKSGCRLKGCQIHLELICYLSHKPAIILLLLCNCIIRRLFWPQPKEPVAKKREMS